MTCFHCLMKRWQSLRRWWRQRRNKWGPGWWERCAPPASKDTRLPPNSRSGLTMNQLDVTQDCIMGGHRSLARRVNNAVIRMCEGCEVAVCLSADCLEQTKREAVERGHRLYIVCEKCA